MNKYFDIFNSDGDQRIYNGAERMKFGYNIGRAGFITDDQIKQYEWLVIPANSVFYQNENRT